ncbi:MAG: endonuclease/exonuclease/phosphatase family protein [Bacteroidota bacterium]
MTNNAGLGAAPRPARRGRRVVRLGLRVAEVALVGLLIMAFTAAYVPPDTLWWGQFVAIFSGLLLAIVAVVAAIAAVKRQWRRAALHASLLTGALLMPALSARPDPVPAPPDAPGLTVMTFNASVRHAGSEQDALAALLARDKPHLIALQEFSIRLIRETGVTMGAPLLGPLLKDRAYEASWPDTEGKDYLFSRPIFSRIQAQEQGEVLAGDPPTGPRSGGLWSSGGITRRLYRWDGRTIALYNVHLHSFSSHRPWREADERFSLRAWADALQDYRRDFEVRAEQARVLRRLLDEEAHPFIVCGDFNSTPRSWVYAYLQQGLRDAFREAGSGWGATFPARLPLIRIDYLLVSDAWSVRRAYVDTGLASDHRPVIAELVLRTEPEPTANR